jgi:hypothetical protein
MAIAGWGSKAVRRIPSIRFPEFFFSSLLRPAPRVARNAVEAALIGRGQKM